MTYDKIKAMISDGYYIHCKTKKETYNATNMLLELGFKHGRSGYSKMYADGDIRDELPSNDNISSWYANPTIIDGGEIEYDAKEYPNMQIEYCEFEDYYNFKMGAFVEDGTEICCDMKQLFALL